MGEVPVARRHICLPFLKRTPLPPHSKYTKLYPLASDGAYLRLIRKNKTLLLRLRQCYLRSEPKGFS